MKVGDLLKILNDVVSSGEANLDDNITIYTEYGNQYEIKSIDNTEFGIEINI